MREGRGQEMRVSGPPRLGFFSPKRTGRLRLGEHMTGLRPVFMVYLGSISLPDL